jgi:DNA-binding NarL/FixJ family response regulator
MVQWLWRSSWVLLATFATHWLEYDRMNARASRNLNLLVMHADPIVSAGLVAALRLHPGFDVVARGAEPLTPGDPWIDVVVADYANAMQLTGKEFRSSQGLPGDVKVLALTSNDRETDIRRAIEAGVYGYVLVGGPLGELTDGITAVANGMRYMSPSAAHRMADSLTRTALTLRELEVLEFVAAGQANKSIARQLGIELGTVKSHVSAIMAKLGARSRTQAANIAVARGLVEERLAPEAIAPAANRRVAASHARFA